MPERTEAAARLLTATSAQPPSTMIRISLRLLPVLTAATLISPTFATAEIAVKSGEKIAFLGDSITQGGWSNPAGYVRLVIAGLEANGIKAEPVPAGISGHKSDVTDSRFRRTRQSVRTMPSSWNRKHSLLQTLGNCLG